MSNSMKLPTARFVFDRKHEADEFRNPKRAKKGLVQLEVYQGRIRKWFSTGVKLYKGQWHEQKWVVNHPSSPSLNSQLKSLLQLVEENITRQITTGSFSFSELENAIKLGNQSELVLDVIQSIYDDYVATGKAYTSYMMFSALMTHLREFRRIVRTDDLTFVNITLFDKYLTAEKHFSANTVCLYHAKLKKVCTHLTGLGLLKRNPYDNFPIVKPKNDKVRYLREEELDIFRTYELVKENEIFVRDFCIFQSLTGLAYSDVMMVDMNRNVILRDGRYVLIDDRIKTTVQYSIVVLQPALDILLKYGGRLDRYSLQHINTILNKISQRILGKSCTTHQFRHSFSVMALRHGIPIEYVSKMLGHTNIQTTQRYAKVLAEDVLQQFDKLKDVAK